MNQDTKKKLLLFGSFGMIFLFLIIYSIFTFGDDKPSNQVAEFNPTFSSPTAANSKLLNTEYDKKLEYYKQQRQKPQEQQTSIDVPFGNTSARPDSLAFVTEEERQQYIIDSLKQALAEKQSTSQTKPVPQRTTPRKQRRQPVQPDPVIVEEKKPDPYANFDLNRTSNPLAEKSNNNQSSANPSDRYYEAKFIENTTIVIGEDQSINLRNTEEIKLSNNRTIPRNTVMKGIISNSGNRLHIRVNQIETFDGVINAQLTVVHSDYADGLPLQSENDLSSQSKDKINDAINSAGSRATVNIPFVNVPISVAPKVGGDTRERVYIPASMTFKLRVIHQ